MALLLALNLSAAVDRMIFAVLAPMIQPAFALSNAQLGLLQGPAYAFPYAAALPMAGWLGDRWGARRVLAGSILVWSAGLLLCAVATSLFALVAGRALCGLGQAAVMPVALGTIWHRVPAHRAGRSMALFTGTGTLGRSVAFGLGGLLLGWFGARGVDGAWAAVLVVLAGLNALLLVALIADRSLPGAGSSPGPTSSPRAGGARGLRAALRDRPVWLVATAAGALGPVAIAQAVTAWVASTLVQAHHLPIARAAGLIALASLAAPAGHLIGGWAVDKAREPRRVGLAQAAFAAACMPATAAIAWAGSLTVAIIGVAAVMLAASAGAVMGLARIQRLAPESIRGAANGMFLLLAAVIGGGGGPWTVGLFAGADGIGTALVAVVNVVATIAVVGALAAGFRYPVLDPGPLT